MDVVKELEHFSNTSLAKGNKGIISTFKQYAKKNGVSEIIDLEECLRTMKTKKEKAVRCLLSFYEFNEEVNGITIDTDLNNKIIIDDVNTRRIAMVVYMQNHICTTKQLSDVFMLDARTIRNDLLALEKGIKVLDKESSFSIEYEGWKRYMNISIHPVVLYEDIPNIAALTVGLMQAKDQMPLYAPQFENIARDVYSQLSDYGKERIGLLIEKEGLKESFLQKDIDQHRAEISSSLINMLKSECTGTICIHTSDKDYIFTDCTVIREEGQLIEIEASDHTRHIFPVSAVYRCTSNLKRMNQMEGR